MKNRTHMTILIVVLAALGATGSGCTSTHKRAAAVTGGAAAGGAIGYAVTSGSSPGTRAVATGAGAVVGGGATLLALGRDNSVYQEGVDDGYMLGTSDAIKRQYWLKQALERKGNAGDGAGRRVYYSIPGDTTTEDGRKLVPHTITVPVIE